MKYLLALVLITSPLQAVGTEGSIVVKIENLKNQTGNVLCSLFKDPKSFPD